MATTGNATTNNTNGTADVNSNVDCPLVGFLPFTFRSNPVLTKRMRLGETTYAHLASFLMAVDDFNSRNPAVVPLLANYSNCSVQIPVESSLFVNSDADTWPVVRFLAEQGSEYCAIVAPHGQEPVLTAAVFATGLDVPIIAYNSPENTLTLASSYPRALRVSENLWGMGQAIVRWFIYTGRRNHLASVALVHGLGEQYRNAIERSAVGTNMTHHVDYFVGPPLDQPGKGVDFALQQVKQVGYRSIVLTLDEDLLFELNATAFFAQKYGLIGPDYVWSLNGPFTVEEVADIVMELNNENVTKLVRGMSVIRPLDGFAWNRDDAFLARWRMQNATFVERVNALHPVKEENQPGYFRAGSDYFEGDNKPEPMSSFMYDAVMSLGMGRCNVERSKNSRLGNSNRSPSRRKLKGEKKLPVVPVMGRQRRRRTQAKKKGEVSPTAPKNDHVDAVVNLEFDGASGRVMFRDRPAHPGNRELHTLRFGVYNFQDIRAEDQARHPNHELWYYLTDVQEPSPDAIGTWTDIGTWTQLPHGPFIFANGLSDPPVLTRDPVEQNLLSRGVRATGLAFMALAQFLIVAAAVFVFVNRKHQVVCHAQPVFLWCLLLGALILSFAMLTFSFDEGGGWSPSQLDAACMVTPWLLSLGYITMYFALISKLWRVHRLFQFARRKVLFYHVMGPFLAAVAAAIAILLAWSIADPLQWERKEINPVTEESYGQCASRNYSAYAAPLLVLVLISTIACGVMAYKTRDIDERFSESGWIFYTIFAQAQAIIVGIPVVLVLDDESANGYYLGATLLTFVICVTTVALMIVPKALKVYRPTANGNDAMRRSGMGTVHVRGVVENNNAITAAQRTIGSRPQETRTKNQPVQQRNSQNTSGTASTTDHTDESPAPEEPSSSSESDQRTRRVTFQQPANQQQVQSIVQNSQTNTSGTASTTEQTEESPLPEEEEPSSSDSDQRTRTATFQQPVDSFSV